MEKICTKCKISKDLSEFSKDKYKSDGYVSRCKSCGKEYREANKDRFKAWNAEHYKNNPEIHKAKKQRLKENNPDYFKNHYKKNKEKKQAYKKIYNTENRDIINERLRKRYHTDPQFRISQTYRNRLRSTITRGYKKSKSLDLLGCSISELKLHLENLFLPTMTWENYGTLWHIDHIVPCAIFDLTNESDQKKCFHYTNLQPLFAITTIIDGVEYIGNIQKSDTVI